METTLAVLSNNTMGRINVIAQRTESEAMGIIKALMINELRAKLATTAHFVYKKKNGQLREAWGTINSNLMQAKIKGNGIPRDYVNCVGYWDIEKEEFRSLRFENLIRVF